MTTVRNIWFTLLFPLMWWGCVTSVPYQMQVIRPAQITIPPLIKSVMVIDNSFPLTDSVGVNVFMQDTFATQIFFRDVVDSIAMVVNKGLAQELAARRFFDTVHVIPVSFNGPLGFDGKPLMLDRVALLSDSMNVDGAVVLNSYGYEPALKYTHSDIYGFYDCIQSIRFVVEWLFVDARTGISLDRHIQVDTLYWRGSVNGLLYPVDGIPDLAAAIVETGKYMGYYHADRLAPYWEPVVRHYYPRGSGYYPEAQSWVILNKWDEAEKIWFHLYKGSRGAEKARLAMNIALAKEIQGKMEDAARWAYHGWELFLLKKFAHEHDADKAKAYYLDLVKRHADVKKLSQQYGTPLN